MSSKSKYVPVVFENSLGETISNDPIFLAQQTLAAAGIALQAEEDDSEETLTVEPATQVEDYKSLDGAALKALAAERGVEIGDAKTVGDLRKLFIQADAAAAAAAEVEAANAQ